MAEAVESEVSS